MRSISNNLLSSNTTIVKEMTGGSLQELNYLQAAVASLNEKTAQTEETADDGEYSEYEDSVEDDDTEDDTLFAEMTENDTEDDGLLAEMEEDDSYEEDNSCEDIIEQEQFDDEDSLTEEEQVDVEEEQTDADEKLLAEMDSVDEEEDTYEDIDTDSEYFDEGDGFEDDYEEIQDQHSTANTSNTPTTTTVLRPPVASTPIKPPVVSMPVKPPMTTPISLAQNNSQTSNSNQSLTESMDIEEEFDEQDDEMEYAEDALDIGTEILEKSEVAERIDEKKSDGAPKIANSFEKIEPECETSGKNKISPDVKFSSDVQDEIDEFLANTDEDEELDLSLLDDVPLISKQPIETETTQLEMENERLRKQLAELENEKLKKQLEEHTKQATQSEPIKLNIWGVIPVQKQNVQETVKPTETKETDKETEQKKRWAKYAAMSTQDLWKLVYRFMNMAGVQKAPVKAAILFEEFGSRNIKRLESTYIMTTKDGYTC